tara:strand:+ start:882 stop:1202 length:321 start_codon:yes stop_codon:yes gene_type:complete
MRISSLSTTTKRIKENIMKRFYRLFISLLVIVGIVAVAPATTVSSDSDKQQCITKAGSCGGDQVVYAAADIKKKKKKGKKLKGKAGKGKKGGWGKWKSKWKKKKTG